MRLCVELDHHGLVLTKFPGDSRRQELIFANKSAQSDSQEEFELKRDYCETLLKACYKLMEYENEGAEHVFEILDMVANYDWPGKE